MNKNILTHLKMIPIIIYPYLYMLGILFIFIFAVIEGSITNDYEYSALSVFLIIPLALFITLICLVIAIINSIKAGKNCYGIYYPTRMNLIIKLVQIPAYTINFILGLIGLFMSIWGIGVLALVLIVDFLSIVLSGINNIGCCINLYKNKIISKKLTILFIILSFIYVIDVFVALGLFLYLRKNNIKEIINKVNI